MAAEIAGETVVTATQGDEGVEHKDLDDEGDHAGQGLEGVKKVLVDLVLPKEKMRFTSREVKKLVKEATAENLEMAAQLLEDSCGDLLKWPLKYLLEGLDRGRLLNGNCILKNSKRYPEMSARLLMVKRLKVRGILTTNYDQLLCFCKPPKQPLLGTENHTATASKSQESSAAPSNLQRRCSVC
jgi:hypothetical protein